MPFMQANLACHDQQGLVLQLRVTLSTTNLLPPRRLKMAPCLYLCWVHSTRAMFGVMSCSHGMPCHDMPRDVMFTWNAMP